jgi:hypothetical protein
MKKAESVGEMRVLNEEEVRHVTGGSSGNFPPGQFPSGNPAKAPGNSNPNENGGPK